MMRALARSLFLSPRMNFFIPALARVVICMWNSTTLARTQMRFFFFAWCARGVAAEASDERAVAECAWHFLRAARKTAVTLSDKSMPDANSSLGSRFIAHFVIGRARLRPGNLTSACLRLPRRRASPAICVSLKRINSIRCIESDWDMCWFFRSKLLAVIIRYFQRQNTRTMLPMELYIHKNHVAHLSLQNMTVEKPQKNPHFQENWRDRWPLVLSFGPWLG